MGIPARELREEVGSLLMRMLVPENPPQLVPLRRLARFLADRQDTVAWFTTNYDTTVEESALVEGLPLSTGFTDGKWTGDFGDATLRLHKLHGSLPWYSDGVLVQAGQEYGSGQLNRVGLPPLRQFLILPQRHKEYREPLATLLNNFTHALAHATVLLSIGYRWRDSLIVDMTREALQLNPRLRLVLEDPEIASLLDLYSSPVHRLVDVPGERVIPLPLPLQSEFFTQALAVVLYKDADALSSIIDASYSVPGRGLAPSAARALGALPQAPDHLADAIDRALTEWATKRRPSALITVSWLLVEVWRGNHELPTVIRQRLANAGIGQPWLEWIGALGGDPRKAVVTRDTGLFRQDPWDRPIQTVVRGTIVEPLTNILVGGPHHAVGSFIQKVRCPDGSEGFMEVLPEERTLGDPLFLQRARPVLDRRWWDY